MPSIVVQRLDDAGEEALGRAVGIVGSACQQQVFELIERHHDGNAETVQHLHQHLEQRQHQVLPRRPHLEVEFREAVGQEVGEVGLVIEQDGAREPLEDVAAHQTGGVVRRRLLDLLADQVASPLRIDAGFDARPPHALRPGPPPDG